MASTKAAFCVAATPVKRVPDRGRSWTRARSCQHLAAALFRPRCSESYAKRRFSMVTTPDGWRRLPRVRVAQRRRSRCVSPRNTHACTARRRPTTVQGPASCGRSQNAHRASNIRRSGMSIGEQTVRSNCRPQPNSHATRCSVAPRLVRSRSPHGDNRGCHCSLNGRLASTPRLISTAGRSAMSTSMELQPQRRFR